MTSNFYPPESEHPAAARLLHEGSLPATAEAGFCPCPVGAMTGGNPPCDPKGGRRLWTSGVRRFICVETWTEWKVSLRGSGYFGAAPERLSGCPGQKLLFVRAWLVVHGPKNWRRMHLRGNV